MFLHVLLMGIPDIVTEHGDALLLLEHLHLSASALQHKISAWQSQLTESRREAP